MAQSEQSGNVPSANAHNAESIAEADHGSGSRQTVRHQTEKRLTLICERNKETPNENKVSDGLLGARRLLGGFCGSAKQPA